MQKEVTAKLMYPDPMKPSGFEFELPEQADITLEVFDENGNHYKTIFDKKRTMKGIHQIDFAEFHLSEGEYTLRLIASIMEQEFRIAKKIVIRK